MGFFSFSANKSSKHTVKDLVWKSQEAKFNGSLSFIKNYTDAFWFCWFPQTQSNFKNFLNIKGFVVPEIRLARSSSPNIPEGSKVIFLEHYPLRINEENFIREWVKTEIFVFNSLDEPLFQQFGGNRIIGLMEKMGMDENEYLEHSMISASIKNAQDKLQGKISVEMTTNSAEDWFRTNIKTNKVF